jgi:hypothetical protein
MGNSCACTKERRTPSQPTAAASDGFDKRLLAYAAVAGAGLLAAAPSAQAGLIYNSTTFTNNYPGAGGFNIDLNNDGTNDFSFNTSASSYSGISQRSFWGSGSNGAQMLRLRDDNPDARFVPGSSHIVPPGPAAGGAWMGSAGLARAAGYWWSSSYFGFMSTWMGKGVSGQFANAGEGYLGVRIPTGVPNSYNYGWIRFNITADDSNPDLPIDVTVRGWAYETTPDTAIHAGDEGGVPEPGSLGLLAGGVLGLAAWRRRKGAQS